MAIDDKQAWAAVMRRDRAFDGQFVTGVLSTGIYCRPSCAARHPARANVRFFADGAQARLAGLRACRRCLPDDVARDEAAVRAAIDAIRSGESPTLEELGAITGYSPTHFSRVFKRTTGLSPAAYARALKEERVRDALSGSERVTDAIYDAGYEAPSRFYAAMEGKMGMSPSAWKNGGRGVTIRWAVVETTLGEMLVAATDKGVCRLSFNEGEAELRARFPEAELAQGGADFSALLGQVIDAVETPGTGQDIPLDVAGTAFQEACWKALRQIPPGETRSYSEIAAAAGNPRAVRAAGTANGANNVAVLIPCHRVIRSDGAIGGYAYGTQIKEELLRREGEPG
ncbi:MAG: bifunctional transcriptional activator/DNA repair enzyme protein Ada [Citromicrobium sp.]|nr:bifunctional transcriptional activator/DNA repair enzyme protein Ada [Citromicrobium sp.]MAO94856.1 bifunctional transcriptional activator/DNA repair enzyme protein Ada [Citromicrobium sp.]MAS85857.1 bifunctional transcriptional activator/DNA repair enzyme protein Ada [Erythrobacteraceae bacterium]MBD75948.1 bifunctional transcriptional activator/DNA repair enzyme protein Ada [Citromicrobium sp.]MBT46633.1 bifunctional transcriptional activator/DNA repair enzyme protein Ada [Citromicrobium s|tara:strand:+ start:3151 stop:4176 length:1026 start_codon:yes stop_codon:yes gene_type:complete